MHPYRPSSDLLSAAVTAERNAQRLEAWRIRWLMRFREPATGTRASIARSDLLFPERRFRGQHIDLADLRDPGTARRVPPVAVRLRLPADAERHGNSNLVRMQRYRNQIRNATIPDGPAPDSAA